MKKYAFLLLLSLQLLFGCRHETTEIEKFDGFFRECVADTIKIATIHDPEATDRLINGKAIPVIFYHLFEFPRELKEYQTDSSKIFVDAYGKIKTGDRIGYLIHFYSLESRVPHFICLYFYDKNTGKMGLPEIVDYSYGAEGTESYIQSWFCDLNKDGNKDLLKRVYSCNLIGSDAKVNFVDTLTVKLWEDGRFKETIPGNCKQLKEGFIVDNQCLCCEPVE
ncbi:MAG: hypothetical protein JWP12_1526 [Bacteroidetes bacterium]|nr:hypothetical protein [Bacteroidota bacterium]